MKFDQRKENETKKTVTFIAQCRRNSVLVGNCLIEFTIIF